jgi:lipopolysaccharide/colanic/teichoic acid biosynthesis glycosyltransferase
LRAWIAPRHAGRTLDAVNSKRLFDLVLGSLGLAVASPIMAGIVVATKLSGDHGPVLHRARRVGEGGRIITVLKIRTMFANTEGSRLTGPDDPRVTPLGRHLRRYRLDELPQLINVLRGEMSLVGPRPEDPTFVDMTNPLHRRVFGAKPGITGLAQLQFHDEAGLLAGEDPERVYREEILPAKLQLDEEYLQRRTTLLDLEILFRTIGMVVGRRSAPPKPPLR